MIGDEVGQWYVPEGWDEVWEQDAGTLVLEGWGWTQSKLHRDLCEDTTAIRLTMVGATDSSGDGNRNLRLLDARGDTLLAVDCLHQVHTAYEYERDSMSFTANGNQTRLEGDCDQGQHQTQTLVLQYDNGEVMIETNGEERLETTLPWGEAGDPLPIRTVQIEAATAGGTLLFHEILVEGPES